MKKIVIWLPIVIILASCYSSKHIDREIESNIETPVTIINTKIEYKDRLIYDSLYIHDSIYTYIKEDTVYIYKEKTRYKYYATKDTVLKQDTIRIPVTLRKTIKEKETEIKETNVLYWWQKLLMWLGVFVVLGAICFVVYKFKK